MKIDTHIHTKYSPDSITPLEDIISYSKKIGLKAIAFTDHDEIEANKYISKIPHDDLLIIPGEEVSTNMGHMIALGITDYIKPQLTPEETVDLIHDNAGIAIAAHPYCFYRSGIGSHVKSLSIDAIETKNSRFILGVSNFLSKRASIQKNIPPIGASDAHFINGIGRCYTKTPDTDNIDMLLKNIKKGKTEACGRRTSFYDIGKEVYRKKGHRTKPKEV